MITLIIIYIIGLILCPILLLVLEYNFPGSMYLNNGQNIGAFLQHH